MTDPRGLESSDTLTGLPTVHLEQEPTAREEFASKLLLVAVVRVVVVTAALGVLAILAALETPRDADAVETWHYVLIGVAYGLSLVYAALLRVPRLLLPLAYVQAVLDALVVSVLVLMTGGVESVFAFAYVFAVLGASLTLYRRGALVSAAFSTLMFGTVFVVQLDGVFAILPRVDTAAAAVSYFVHSLGVVLVAILASTLAERARITRVRLAEKEIDFEHLQELHAAILRSLPAGLMTIDGHGQVRFANEAAKVILRSKDEDFIGQALDDVAPAMTEAWAGVALRGFSDRRERFEEEHVRADGTVIRVGFSFAPLTAMNEDLPSSIVVFQDVTDIVKLKEAVEQAGRLATVGKFAAGLAHEVRNPLASMCASIDVLRAGLEVPESMERLMRNVVKEAERLNALITDFLAFSRPRKLDLKDTDLGELVRDVLTMAENDELMARCRIETKLDLGVRASVDTDLVRQVVWNLVKNAGESMAPDGGDLWIETTMRDFEPVLIVRDTGPGMDKERLRRVFDPFFTTKAGGSGLGLAITHSIVEAHGAKIAFESQAGEGTTVTIRFRRDLAGVSVQVPQSTNPGALPSITDELDYIAGGR